jgi:hypothetical protein
VLSGLQRSHLRRMIGLGGFISINTAADQQQAHQYSTGNFGGVVVRLIFIIVAAGTESAQRVITHLFTVHSVKPQLVRWQFDRTDARDIRSTDIGAVVIFEAEIAHIVSCLCDRCEEKTSNALQGCDTATTRAEMRRRLRNNYVIRESVSFSRHVSARNRNGRYSARSFIAA